MCPRERTVMRSTREIIRLSFELELSGNEIARATGISRGVVQNCINAAKKANIRWTQAVDLDDMTLERILFTEENKDQKQSEPGFVEPEYEWINREMKKRGVNMQLLWTEYIGETAKGKYSYSQFNRKYRKWLRRQELSMRQEHKAGDKLFVDYAGQTVPVVIDRETGDVKMAQIFVAVLGASNYHYVEGSWSQDLPSWINAHVRAFNFLKGVPQCLVPDNLKSGVTKAESFDPLINRTYHRMAQHYGCHIRAARKIHPKDKAKVEKGVQYSETWILARLRNFTFFSLQQLNETIQELLGELNNQPFQKMSGTRYSQYQAIDLPALGPLPKQPFELEDWLVDELIGKDYHITVEGHHYSVPHQLRGERVDVRYTDAIVEVLHNNIRAASHLRNKIEGGISTSDEHRPPQHALYAGMSAELFLRQAAEVGVFTRQVISAIIEAHPYPQLAFDKCFGILSSLRRKYGDDRIEAVAEYALRIGSPTYGVMKAALEAGSAMPQQLTISTFDGHENIRGPMEFA